MKKLESSFLVYLAGPITGLTFGDAEDWRTTARENLAHYGIKGISPLRGKEYLASLGKLSGTCEEYGDISPLSSPRGIMTRDHYDATRCDVLFANLIGADKVSVGTVMEIAWAFTHKIPVIVCMESKGNPHEHAMIAEAIGFRAVTLEQGLHFVKAIADNEQRTTVHNESTTGPR